MKSKVLALILLCGAASLGAKVKLPALVGDNMILQQQTEVKLWGTAAPEAEVRVTPSWNGQTMTCRADKDGGWTLAVETPAAGYTPYEITFDDGEKTTLKNILIGEVWLASGFVSYSKSSQGFTRRISLSTARYNSRFSQRRQWLVWEAPKFLHFFKWAL